MPGVLEQIHAGYVASRRVRVLSAHLDSLIAPHALVLDVGCGDGALAHTLVGRRPDLKLQGVDVLARSKTWVPVDRYDGQRLPYAAGVFDSVLLIDTLHHTRDPMRLLQDAVRVASQAVIIKDHLCHGVWATATLRFMDEVGNARHGVALPHTYWSKPEWDAAFAALGLRPSVWLDQLGLYPWPANLVFERSLHFMARLDK